MRLIDEKQPNRSLHTHLLSNNNNPIASSSNSSAARLVTSYRNSTRLAMAGWLDYYFLITIPVFVIFLLVSVCNCVVNKTTVVQLLKTGSLVSVLVPARNEAENIARLLDSLSHQSYENYEILVLDDNSSDQTFEIATRMALLEARIKVVHGLPLPSTWYGKSFAMQQLYEMSVGSVVLFTDADTVHGVDSISFMVSSLTQHDCDLVSGYPRQVMASIGELVLVPCIFGVKIFLPFCLVQALKHRRVSFAIGQYICVTRAALDLVEGFDAVRDAVCEDLVLAQRVKQGGLKTAVVAASGFVSCRMYRNYSQSFLGLAKAVFPSLGYSYFAALLTSIFIFTTLFPIGLIGWGLFGTSNPSPAFQLYPGITVVIFTTAWSVALWDENLCFLLALLYPIHMINSFALLIYSTTAIGMGFGVTWKGRRVK